MQLAKEFIKSQGPDFSVVANGGYYTLERQSTMQLAYKNFGMVQEYLDLDIEAAGGKEVVEKLSADPKGELVNMIVNSKKDGEDIDEPKLVAISGILAAMGKGFEADLFEGEWTPVLGGKYSVSEVVTVSDQTITINTDNRVKRNLKIKVSKTDDSCSCGSRLLGYSDVHVVYSGWSRLFQNWREDCRSTSRT